MIDRDVWNDMLKTDARAVRAIIIGQGVVERNYKFLLQETTHDEDGRNVVKYTAICNDLLLDSVDYRLVFVLNDDGISGKIFTVNQRSGDANGLLRWNLLAGQTGEV